MFSVSKILIDRLRDGDSSLAIAASAGLLHSPARVCDQGEGLRSRLGRIAVPAVESFRVGWCIWRATYWGSSGAMKSVSRYRASHDMYPNSQHQDPIMKLIARLTVAILVTLIGYRAECQTACVPLPLDAVAWWSLDESNRQRRRLIRVGEQSPGPGPVALFAATGEVRGALSFNGTKPCDSRRQPPVALRVEHDFTHRALGELQCRAAGRQSMGSGGGH